LVEEKHKEAEMSTNQKRVVLMAEDDEDDLLLVKAALAASGLPVELRSVSDGEELIEYLSRRNRFANPCLSPMPNLILLDLNMPRKDGRQALAEIKANPNFEQIPVVVLTTSSDTSDIWACHELGADSFVTKPNNFQALVNLLMALGKNILDAAETPGYNSAVEQESETCK
jgi:CheY-like chemotaxis protein